MHGHAAREDDEHVVVVLAGRQQYVPFGEVAATDVAPMVARWLGFELGTR